MSKNLRCALEVQGALRDLADEAQAELLKRFFKTGPGEYGEGDRFLGIKVPVVRDVVKNCRDLPLEEGFLLLESPMHEERLASLVFLVQRFETGDGPTRKRIFDFYLNHTARINNWDLVDVSAPQIVGGHLPAEDTSTLASLAKSALIWDRRISIVATFAYIREGIFGPTLKICELLLRDKHDLIQKACGWMLREVGKRDRSTLEGFLKQHAATMPRTMLRYAIEHFEPETRRRYMRKQSNR